MWTGQKTLQSITQALASANNEAAKIEQSLQQLTQHLSASRREQTHAFKELAALRLDQIHRDKLQTLITEADRRAQHLLAEREKAFENLEQKIKETETSLQNHEAKREAQANIVDEHSQALINSERIAQQSLEKDETFQAQLALTRKTDSIADQAEEKMQMAESDRQEKGKPFEADSLFMYLWARSYGTPEYNANPLARWLDGMVARLCDYDKARVNYWMLLELPKRLQQHAEDVRNTADKDLLVLQTIEREFALKHGVVEAQEALSKQREQLDELDEAQIKREHDHHELIDERARYNRGEDTYYQQALNELSKVIQRKDTYELQRLSNRTLDPQDDHIVANLVDAQNEEKEIQENINEYRHLQKIRTQRVRELEKVRGQFKHNRFDDIRSGFNNGSLIGVALNEFLKGALNQQDLWRTIERSQRHRNVEVWPDFGGGGFGHSSGRRKSGGTWHRPRGRSGGGFRFPSGGGSSSRSRSNGGFRTGGGF